MKPLLLLPTLLSLATLSLHADDVKRVALDGTTAVQAPVQEDGKDGIARIHKIDEAALELFPATGKKAQGTVLIFPGGGYGILAVTHEGRDVAKMLNEAGWDAAVLLYHVSEGAKTREMALEDARKALELVQKKGATLGLSQHAGVMGFSAGGHLAARLAHETASSAPPAFVVLLYPAYLDSKGGPVLDEVAPVKGPVFEYVAADDQFSSGAVAYEKACKEKGIRCELHLPAKGGHGFGLKAGMPESVRDWPEKLRAFLASTS